MRGLIGEAEKYCAPKHVDVDGKFVSDDNGPDHPDIDNRIQQFIGQVSFQWKNPDFLLKNPDFLF